MRKLMPVLMSFGAPLLIAVAVVAMQQRQGTDRSHALPALLVGSWLIVSSAAGRRRRRARLLSALRTSRAETD
ncbi:MAG TPA: DUF3188 domain-containing protein [Synechococcus sp. UBA9887]|nr:DUF3188 domain-containing protein [Synechococcus sp. UBA9887]